VLSSVVLIFRKKPDWGRLHEFGSTVGTRVPRHEELKPAEFKVSG
jgi:hypothetical protein